MMAGIEFKIEADANEAITKLNEIKAILKEIERTVISLQEKGIDIDLITTFLQNR